MKAILQTRDGCVRVVEINEPLPPRVTTHLDASQLGWTEEIPNLPCKTRAYDFAGIVDSIPYYLEVLE